ILLPADFESRNVENVIKKKPIDIKINIEINLFKYEEGLYVEYKDTLKTIVWDCDVAWGEKD
ncbi:MAG: hypothetical protein FWF51_10270, partial [Chitinivibrionia bacterium]|nr:hypothetical protein [Chitinivibrionia bacterium]